MSPKVVLTREAERDLAEIFEWYEGRRVGLGHEFLLHTDAGLRLLETNPSLFPEKHNGVRQYLLRRFPYKIFYRVEEDCVTVLAVVHGGRDPSWVRKRLRRWRDSEEE